VANNAPIIPTLSIIRIIKLVRVVVLVSRKSFLLNFLPPIVESTNKGVFSEILPFGGFLGKFMKKFIEISPIFPKYSHLRSYHKLNSKSMIYFLKRSPF